MGLRHLTVVDDHNEVVGMITRKDLVEPMVEERYRQLVASGNVLMGDPDAAPLRYDFMAASAASPANSSMHRTNSYKAPPVRLASPSNAPSLSSLSSPTAPLSPQLSALPPAARAVNS